jgi:hypothetical protein
MLIGSMGGLGKKGKKKTSKMVQKRAEICKNLTKVIKSAHFFAKSCRNLTFLYFNIM